MIFRFAIEPSSLSSLLQRAPGTARRAARKASTGAAAVPATKPAAAQMPLCDLKTGGRAVIEAIQITGEALDRLMLFGFMPGATVRVRQSGPGGDPRVYRVDGTDVALRRETTRFILVRPLVEERD